MLTAAHVKFATASQTRSYAGVARRVLAAGPLPPPVNGMSSAFALLTRDIAQRNRKLTVLDLADRGPARRSRSFSIHRLLGILRSLARGLFLLPTCDVFYLTISQSPLGFAKDLVLILAAGLFGRPVVVHLHGGNYRNFYTAQPWLYRRLIRGTLDRVAFLIVLSESLRSQFDMTRHWQERTATVGNACEIAVGSPRDAMGDVLRVLFLSNLHVAKGYLDVLAAGPLLREALPGRRIELHFAGAFALGNDAFPSVGAMEADFADRAKRLPPGVRAIRHGVVTGERKAALLDECDVFVLPSANEGQPISILEAMARGLPVVATASGAIAETLPREMEPLLVPPGDPEAIAARVARLATDPGFYSAASRGAVRRARDFSVDAHVTKVVSILDAATGMS